eukprot:GEMP01048720.1.p1 GENE.GEMP01048720.1~~GEMP01048720.1.p1  ORF type:complete len:400 (+),score=86.71 GEMP01048720.1:77-1201(+)
MLMPLLFLRGIVADEPYAVKLDCERENREERERISMERQQEHKKREEELQKYTENISKMTEENARLRREQEAKILAGIEEERQRIEEEAAKARQAAIEVRQNYPVPPYLSSFLVKINVCVTGPSGVGKSSLINAVCGRDEDSAGAAKTGVTETTLKPTAFCHPEFPQVILWDFPGVGTQNFPQETYIRDMGLKHFACVLLVCSTRFTENDRMLLAELERVKLPYFCVRSKFDQDCDNRLKSLNKTQRREPKMKELPPEIMREIFQEINDDLRKQGVSSPYIVSALESDVGDFAKLLRDLHAWVHRFANERSPMLVCSVCRRGEDQSPIVFCSKCKNFVCDKCSAMLPFCDECPACKCPACYRPVGQQCNEDEKA